MYTQNESGEKTLIEWPVNAVPQNWIEALFEKMTTFYGVKFADQWRGTPLAKVKVAWGIELGKLTRPQWKAGVASLSAFPKPPTLPEFIEHCRRARIDEAAQEARRIEDAARASDETVEANMPQLRKAAAMAVKRSAGSVDWAYWMIQHGTARNGTPLSVGTIHDAEDAILDQAGFQAAVKNRKYAEIRRAVMAKRGGGQS